MLFGRKNEKKGFNSIKEIVDTFGKTTKYLSVIIVLLTVSGMIMNYRGTLRFDQYSMTILSTSAGIVGTMFGLTAASYAFIWGDLRSDRKENIHLEKVLEKYRKQLWFYFMITLIITISVIFISLSGMAIAQYVMDDTLFETVGGWILSTSSYQNRKFKIISAITCVNLGLSLFDIVIMVKMNWTIFRRSMQYADIAKNIIENINNRYELKIPEQYQKYSNSEEYEKIHNLEIIIDKILKNHESIGEAFTESQRREKLLNSIICNNLKEQYGCGTQKGDTSDQTDCYIEKMQWSHLSENKKKSRFERCKEVADKEWKLVKQRDQEKSNERKGPIDCCFIDVYGDLISYRDNSLIYDENSSGKKTTEIMLSKSVCLRYSIKRRLLSFYLTKETFTSMDCTNMSFSGADLRYTNFSGSNLSHVRLKGANCENADFTAARMTGMYFSDIGDALPKTGGEIQLTYNDDGKEMWSPYNGREATCLKNATFKEADVSRIYLKAPGNIRCNTGNFPFGDDHQEFDSGNKPFSLDGTNFDYAKMFNASLKNVSLRKASLERAQLYNAGIVMTKAKSSNFSNATMTNACFAWCDFENADFSGALMSEAILLRVDFRGAKLSKANFSYSNIIACNFYGTSCQDVSFKNMTQNWDALEGKEKPDALSDINLGKKDNSNSQFEYSILTNTDFSGAKLDGIIFSNCVGQNCLFAEAEGKKVKIRESLFRSSVFNSTCFQDSTFENTIFSNSVFIDAKFTDSMISNVDFSDAAFTVSKKECFVGKEIIDSKFTNVKGLTEECFKDIKLIRVDFRGTGLTEKKFKDAANNVILEECIWSEE